MLKIRHIPQMGLQISHHIDNGLGDLVAFIPIGYGNGMIYHLLKMSPVFGNNKMRTLSIVF